MGTKPYSKRSLWHLFHIPTINTEESMLINVCHGCYLNRITDQYRVSKAYIQGTVKDFSVKALIQNSIHLKLLLTEPSDIIAKMVFLSGTEKPSINMLIWGQLLIFSEHLKLLYYAKFCFVKTCKLAHCDMMSQGQWYLLYTSPGSMILSWFHLWDHVAAGFFFSLL